MAERAVCLRCDWSGDASGACPRCGAGLWSRPAPVEPAPIQAALPAATTPPPAAAVEDRVEARILSPPASAPRRRHGRFRPRWLALAAVLSVLAGTLVSRGDEEPTRATSAPSATPGAPRTGSLALPEGLPALTAPRGPYTVTLATVQQTQAGIPLHRLWELSLPSGSLSPGPVVGKVRQIRSAPTGPERLAFLLEDGGLVVEDGGLFPSSLTWVAGEVDAFDFARDGTLVYLRVRQATAETGGSTQTIATVGSVPPRELVADEHRGELLLPILGPRGIVVRRSNGYVWGLRGGREILYTLDGRTGSLPRTLRLDGIELLDVSPSGLLLARDGGSARIVSPTSRRPPAELALSVERSLAWSPVGGLAVVGTGRGSSGLFVASFPDLEPRELEPGAPVLPEPGHIAFSPDGRFVVWATTSALHVADATTGRSFHIYTPGDLPGLLGPVAVS